MDRSPTRIPVSLPPHLTCVDLAFYVPVFVFSCRAVSSWLTWLSTRARVILCPTPLCCHRLRACSSSCARVSVHAAPAPSGRPVHNCGEHHVRDHSGEGPPKVQGNVRPREAMRGSTLRAVALVRRLLSPRIRCLGNAQHCVHLRRLVECLPPPEPLRLAYAAEKQVRM